MINGAGVSSSAKLDKVAKRGRGGLYKITDLTKKLNFFRTNHKTGVNLKILNIICQ